MRRFHNNTIGEKLARDSADLVQQIGKIDAQQYAPEFQSADPEEVIQHDKFVAALESKYDITIHRWEPVREGLIVYLDAENTVQLTTQMDGGHEPSDQESTPNDEFAQWCEEQGYLILRRGMPEDIEFGGFPVSTSRWVFVYAPVEVGGDGWCDPNSNDKIDGARVADMEKRTNELIKGIKKLHIGDQTNDGVLQKVAKTLGVSVKKWDRV
jgi:hypothetical protein